MGAWKYHAFDSYVVTNKVVFRFRDIARGGLRIVTPQNSDQFALESSRWVNILVFYDCNIMIMYDF